MAVPPVQQPTQPGEGHGANASRRQYERVMRDLDQDAPPQAVGALLLQVAREYFDGGQSTAALDCCEAVLGLSGDDGMSPVLAELYELRGRIRCALGALDEAHEDFLQQQQHAARANLPWLVAVAHEHLASIAIVREAWVDAIGEMERAAAIYRETSSGDDLMRVMLHLATLYVDLRRWNAAELALAELHAAAGGTGDATTVARLELVRAQMAIDRSNAARARMSAERALEHARRADHPGLVADAVAMNAVVARELGDLPRALQLLEDAERQANALGDTMLLGELACARVEALARRDDHRGTLHALNRAYRALVRLLGEPGPIDRAWRLRRLEQEFQQVTRRWAQRFEGVDHDTSGHVDRVADLTCEIARRMGVDPASLLGYRVGAYLHDLGKTAVPVAILTKRGRLTPEEWAAVKRHPVAGADLLAGTDLPWEVRPIVEGHHECWDGSGYPHGRAGEEIPLAARITCVADVYDALITRRPFKHALGSDEAIEVMRRDVGRQFDPAVFRVFEDVLREGIAIPGITSPATPRLALPVEDELVDDPLTGVAEFVSWGRRAANVLASRRSSGNDACLLLVDVDDFTRVNTTYGRLQGDDVLWAMAKVLQRGLRTGDLIGRRSGDEFVVLLPDTSLEVAREVAERLRAGVAELRCARRDTPEEALSVTVGIAVAHAPGDGETLAALLAATDRAHFAASRRGGDQVIGVAGAEPTRGVAALDFSTFTGREDELRQLTSHLDQALGGEPRAVTITGEAGIGKSAFVRQLGGEVRLRSGWMVTGQATGDGTGGALAAWIGVVTRLVELGGTGDRAWLALPQWLPSVFPAHDPTASEPALAQIQQEIVQFVRRAARTQPVVVVLEDMHLAPAATWAVLDSLHSSADDERLLVISTMRPDIQPGAVEWRRRVHQHPRHASLVLRRFSLDDVRRWIRSVFHDAAPGDDVARWAYDLSEGIPRLVLHLLRAGCEDGTIWYGGTRWEWQPPTEGTVASGVSWVLERRLERVSASTRGMLATAALLHPDVTVELLVSVVGVPETQARRALDEAIGASILVSVAAPTGGTTYDFAHDQLRDACLRSTPERQRQQVHDVAARVLELRAPSAVATIAAHYHAAGNDVAAFEYATAAAERAAGIGAHDLALSAFQVAQRYAASNEALAKLRVRHAELAVLAGQYAHAASLCDLALEWLDRQPTTAVTIRGRTVREWVHWRRGRGASRTGELFRGLLDEAARSAPESVAATALAAADAAIGRAAWPEAMALGRRAAVAGSGNDALIAAALLREGEAEHAEQPGAGRTRLRDAMTLVERSGDARLQALGALVMGSALGRDGASAEADELLARAHDRARDAHDSALAAAISRSLGVQRGRQGNIAESRQWLGDAERLFTTLEDEPGRVVTLLESARLLRDQGEREAAYHQFAAVARRAREVDLTWVELAAQSGAALSNGGAASDAGQERWMRANALIADARPDWWFPGRELVDAFAIQVALTGGQHGAAFDLFLRARRRSEETDPWGAAWLVAECAPALEAAGIRSLASTRRDAAEQAQRRGFTALAAVLG
jgi:diguanylate cyclase (GGDEF)-like protein